MAEYFDIHFSINGKPSKRVVTIRSEYSCDELLVYNENLISYVARRTQCKGAITIISVTIHKHRIGNAMKRLAKIVNNT